MTSIKIEYVLAIARYSPCVRRKYGALIADESNFTLATGYNERVSDCCNEGCVRDELKIQHGRNTDAGAEVHAEQAALINLKSFYSPMVLYVAGLNKDGVPLNGFDAAPCYSCARMAAYAGIYNIYLPVDDEWEKFDINDIMETWERKWAF